MPSRSEYEETLDQLARWLKQRPLTARQIATRAGCSRPVAYARLAALRERGVTVQSTRARKHRGTGPAPVTYRVELSDVTPESKG